MKYIFSFLLLLALSSMNAQNLQFSQVLTFAGTSYSNNAVLIGTVPEGKVWKIEFLNQIGTPWYFEINEISISNNTTFPTSFPIWLKANDVLKCRPSSNIVSYFVSIIEFSVVP